MQHRELTAAHPSTVIERPAHTRGDNTKCQGLPTGLTAPSQHRGVCRRQSSQQCHLANWRRDGCKVRLGRGCCEHCQCCQRGYAEGVRNGLPARESTSPGPKEGISAQERQELSPPADPAGSQAPTGDVDDAHAWCQQGPELCMHRGHCGCLGDIGTSPKPSTPPWPWRGPGPVGASLGCQELPDPHPVRAEKGTAGSTHLPVT